MITCSYAITRGKKSRKKTTQLVRIVLEDASPVADHRPVGAELGTNDLERLVGFGLLRDDGLVLAELPARHQLWRGQHRHQRTTHVVVAPFATI